MTAFARRGASLLGVAVLLIAVPVAARFAWVALVPTALAAEGSGGVEVALIRCGLDSEALAAAGLTAPEASTVIADFKTAYAGQAPALAQADANYADARVKSDALTRKVASGLAKQDEVAGLASAKAALSAAEASRSAVLDELITSATAGLAQTKAATLATIRANREQDLPVEFLAEARDHKEWHALRKALANERICAKIGDPPDQAMQSALAAWRAEEACAAAKAACDTNGDAVKSAWDAAVEG